MPPTGTAARSPSWCWRAARAARSTRCTAPSTGWWTRSSRAPTPTSGSTPAGKVLRTSDPETRHQLPHRGRGAVQRRLLLGRELDLDDLLQAIRAEPGRDPQEQVAVAVLAVQVDGAGQDPVPVEQDRLDHLDDGGRRGVVGAAALQKVDDLDPPVARALHDRVDRLLRQELGDR